MEDKHSTPMHEYTKIRKKKMHSKSEVLINEYRQKSNNIIVYTH